MAKLCLVVVTAVLLSAIVGQIASLEVIYALNAGGEAFTDSLGIRYRRDFLTEGVASDYGKILDIKRVTNDDKILYQTERYSTETFGYTIPMPPGDGDYVLWLKFCEVWFNAARLKVFDISLNNVIVIKDLDIFDKVGRGVAYDEHVGFQVRQNKIIVNGKQLPFNNEIRVDFIKTDLDNPKVNALVIMKGTPEQVPKLPPYQQEKPFEFDEESDEDKILDDQREQQKRDLNPDNEDDEEESLKKESNKKRKAKQQSEPKIVNPYESDETSYLLPILVTIGAFIPLLYCLCKL